MALDATIEEVCAWYEAGESIGSIANRLGRASCYVDYRLKKGGVVKRPVGRGSGPRPDRRAPDHIREEALRLYQSGISANRISNILPISKTFVLREIENAGMQKRCQKTDIGEDAERLYVAGMSAAKIGNKLGVNKKTVLRYLSVRGVLMRNQKCLQADRIVELYLSGLSADKVGEMLSVSAGHVFMTLRKFGVEPRRSFKKNVALNLAAIISDYNAGKTPDQISREHGVSRSTILSRISNAGVKIRKWVEKYDHISPCAGTIKVNGTWELAYAKILDVMFDSGLISLWQYEPDKISVGGDKHYIPDFKVFNKTGGHAYHEIKGKLWSKSAAKITAARDAGHNVVLIRRRVLGPICRHYGVSITL